jgi:MATE family multidrug resistance protein
MTWLLWMLMVPIAVLWWFSEPILAALVPSKETASLAALFLRVLIAGMPGVAALETGKRFVQSQGLFKATTYALMIGAPLSFLQNWLFVFKFGWGFVGAAAAMAITQTILPLLLVMYVWLIDGSQCWNGLSRKGFKNWGAFSVLSPAIPPPSPFSFTFRYPPFPVPNMKLFCLANNRLIGPIIKLALPGMIMIEAQFSVLEVLTLSASQFGTSQLAAQSILVTVTSTSFNIPFPLAIATSTRVANLIGAHLSEAARVTAKVVCVPYEFPPSLTVRLIAQCVQSQSLRHAW